MRTCLEIDFLVKCFVSRFGCFSLALRNFSARIILHFYT